ncbi:MAG: heliorhodopsin HeR, partial [Patescibacteria group bacterium]
MATKNKTARAKTKTAAKKTARKTTTKKSTATRAKASRAKSVSKKPQAKKSTARKAADVFMSLKNWNLSLSVLHAVQAIAMAFLARDFRLPIDMGYLTFNSSTENLETVSRTIVDVPLAWIVIAFLAMSAIAHGIIAGPWFENYKADLKKGMNRARWFEYALSASTMMVAIALLTGISSLGILIGIFVLTAVMNLMGLVMEVHNQDTKSTNWLSFCVGCLAGIEPWIIIGLYFLANWLYASGNPPTFVYFIYISIFLFFNCFAINMWLQY